MKTKRLPKGLFCLVCGSSTAHKKACDIYRDLPVQLAVGYIPIKSDFKRDCSLDIRKKI